MNVRAKGSHCRRHDATMKRPSSEEIDPAEQVLAPNESCHAHHAAIFHYLQIDDDPEIQMTIIETENRPLP